MWLEGLGRMISNRQSALSKKSRGFEAAAAVLRGGRQETNPNIKP